MKTVIITVPMMQPAKIEALQYPMDDKAMEYDNPVHCPINAILAKTMKKDEEVNIIYIITKGENSHWEENQKIFFWEIEDINKEIGAKINCDFVEIDFEPTKQTYNKLITDLAEKIPENAELYTDITYGFKPEILSLFCALKFVEEFRDAIVQYIVYGKVEFHRETNEKIKPKLYDITSLYYLFNLMGSMGGIDADTAMEKLNRFFAM